MITASDAIDILQKHYGISGNVMPLESEWGGTFKVTSTDGSRYVLKIAPETVDRERTLMEVSILDGLARENIGVDLPRIVRTANSENWVEHEYGLVRMYNWMAGRLWHDVNPKSPALLNSLGRTLAIVHRSLERFDFEIAHSDFLWSMTRVPKLEVSELKLPVEQKDLLVFAVNSFKDSQVSIAALPRSLCYNDANDFNILVSENTHNPEVSGFIDFGDLHFGPSIQDLAVCLAYATMHFPDPIGAAIEVVKGYNEINRISENEVQSLIPLMLGRLALSIYHAYERHQKDPQNSYWQVSNAPAWSLLQKLYNNHRYLDICRLREACGYEPAPTSIKLVEWLRNNSREIHPVTGIDLRNAKTKIFDWSVSSTELGSLEILDDIPEFTHRVFHQMEEVGAIAGIGRYNEPRIVYTSAGFASQGNNGPEMRTIHIGLDIFMPAGTPLYAPLDGTVHTICHNDKPKEYGPLLILEHRIDAEELTFYTLYGHNSIESLDYFKPGDRVRKGQKIAEIGNYPDNGNWVPHVHFQVITDLMNYVNDFPGVALASQRATWLSICPDPNILLGIDNAKLKTRTLSVEEILTHRNSVLGKNLGVSYSTPLHVVRGWQARLYTSEGTSYLDTVNNISHVGHENPRVVNAAASQNSILNTNTRYLHTTILDLADKLLDTLPEKFTRIYFVNSGSEANDLALRIARNHTGSRETIVMHQAYHGITQSCIEVSPHKFLGHGGQGQLENIHVLPSTLFKSTELCDEEARSVVNKIEGAAIFIHETLPSCAGQVIPPHNYFKNIYADLRVKNGITIADEVQTGLGRTGEAFWAFELYDIEPDIVTMGKPLGNGHPIGAVAITEELYNSFDNGMEFFSSFGGNPVSCATAMSVLETIDEENLQGHAHDLGRYWMKHLIEIQKEFPIIKDVRGHGLFIGIDLQIRSTRKAATVNAKYIQNRMLDHKILISLDGPFSNVIKIKPPMRIAQSEIDYFNATFHKILDEDFNKIQ